MASANVLARSDRQASRLAYATRVDVDMTTCVRRLSHVAPRRLAPQLNLNLSDHRLRHTHLCIYPGIPLREHPCAFARRGQTDAWCRRPWPSLMPRMAAEVVALPHLGHIERHGLPQRRRPGIISGVARPLRCSPTQLRRLGSQWDPVLANAEKDACIIRSMGKSGLSNCRCQLRATTGLPSHRSHRCTLHTIVLGRTVHAQPLYDRPPIATSARQYLRLDIALIAPH
jgi:hypothetical protein